MNKLINLLKFFVTSILTKVAIEFIWQLFAVSFGIALVRYGLKLTDDLIINEFYSRYGELIVLVVFNAALLRVIIAYGLEWIDKEIEKLDQAQAETRQAAKTGLKLALLQIMGKRIPSPDEPEEPSA